MKKYRFLALLFFSPGILFAQTNDSFSDGDVTADPPWSGDIGRFIVNNAQQLQLNSTIAGTSYLSTSFVAASIDNLEWSFYVRQSFSPSANNYSRIYLVSDNPDLSLPLNGYFLQLGEAGSADAIELFRQSGTAIASVCRAANAAIATSFSARIIVRRDAMSLWEISVDYNESGTLVREGSGQDSTWKSSMRLGIVCVYTASNSTKFYFDDIHVGPKDGESTGPPSVQPKDIILTELYPDFSPSIGLPEAEYIEIFNRSLSPINLSGFTISDGSSTAVLPSQQILSHEYKVLIPITAASLFIDVPNTIGVAGFPSLNNDGDALTLRSPDGTLVDSVRYTISSYHNRNKEDGGWSLELIDPENSCGGEDNWTASEATIGGTPGHENSVLANKPDLTGPQLLSILAAVPDTLLLKFDEALEKSLPVPDSFSISPHVPIIRCGFTDSSLRTILLLSGMPFQPGQLYTVTIPRIRDCSGNSFHDGSTLADFALPEPADSLDLVINEVLFNPRPNGVDFIELCNRSAKFISLDGWKLGAMEDRVLKDIHALPKGHLLGPHSILAFTPDPTILKNNYPMCDESRFTKTDLPSLPDDEGSIVVVNNKGNRIDYFQYNRQFHSDLIHDDEGVSLERISSAGPTNDRQNWKSASSQAGYATPGMVNSNTRPEDHFEPGTVTIEPEIFIPQSGNEDFARISYSFDPPGLVANITVVDQQGHEIKTIANNETLGFQGFFRWDGDRDDGTRARAGYYLLWMEVFDVSGYVRTYRKRIILAGDR